ncbi:MAG: hypothetical protein U5L11_00965 [Arhodomonas sp.]|nr:hypothetical protein [Arhodomonas sp.]
MGKARLRAAGEAIREEQTSEAEDGSNANAELDLGFKVLQLGASNIRPWTLNAGRSAGLLFSTPSTTSSLTAASRTCSTSCCYCIPAHRDRPFRLNVTADSGAS